MCRFCNPIRFAPVQVDNLLKTRAELLWIGAALVQLARLTYGNDVAVRISDFRGPVEPIDRVDAEIPNF